VLGPLVADDAVIPRQRAGGQGGVTDRGLGRTVCVVRVFVDGATLQELAEAAPPEAVARALQEVRAQLIDADQHHQAEPGPARRRRLGSLCVASGSEQREREHERT
jgi:class 3 adenylate cyclase